MALFILHFDIHFISNLFSQCVSHINQTSDNLNILFQLIGRIGRLFSKLNSHIRNIGILGHHKSKSVVLINICRIMNHCGHLSDSISILNIRFDDKGFRHRSVYIAFDVIHVTVEPHVPIRGPLTEPLSLSIVENTQDQYQTRPPGKDHSGATSQIHLLCRQCGKVGLISIVMDIVHDECSSKFCNF